MAQKYKYYVVVKGYQPGIYDTWEECQAQIDGYPGAQFKSYPTCEEATMAFRQALDIEEAQFYTFLSRAKVSATNYEAHPEIRTDAIAVDGACDHNPGGNVEYQGVRVGTGEVLFHFGPEPGGSNNIGEYLGLVHALAMLDKAGDTTTPIYTDSKTALSWLRQRRHRSTVKMDPNSRLAQVLARADAWLQSHALVNPVLKWNTEEWGEIPADFGRK